MNKTILIIGLIVAMGVNLRSEDEAEAQETKDPKDLVSARATYQNSVKAVVEPLKKKYIIILTDMKKKYGAKGDTDGMLAMDKEIKSLSEKADKVEDEEDVDVTDAKDLIGVWLVGNDRFTFYADKTWTSPWTSLCGTWKNIKKGKDKDSIYELTSNTGNNQVFTVSTKTGSIWAWNKGNNKAVAVKTKEKAEKPKNK